MSTYPIVHSFSGKFVELPRDHVHAYIVELEHAVVIVDATLAISSAGELRAKAEALGKPLQAVLLTHGHIDHCGSTGIFARELGVPIEGPEEADRFWIARLNDDGRKYGIDGEVFEPTRWLHDGDTVTIGDCVLDVVHCPGHTPGHVVFFHAPSRFAIVGDVIFAGSIGRTDFPRGNHADLIRSIRDNLFVLGDDVQFLPGHGGLSTFGAERQTNPYVSDRAVGAARVPTHLG